MKHITTNIRLPEDLWQELKREALEKRQRLSQVIRERLGYRTISPERLASLRGLWKDKTVSEKTFRQAKTVWQKKLDL